jgi:streptogramin lyase
MRLGHALTCTLLCLPLVLTGCALQQTASPALEAGVKLTGSVYGGQQPIVGAHVYLLAANTTGYGGPGIPASGTNASISLLNAANTGLADSLGAYVLTGTHGNFTITGDYTCTSNTPVYLYVLGGNPGAGENSAAGLLAALGNCPSSGSFLASIPFIQVNEVTTIAAAYAMAGFATDATHVSSSGTPLALTGIAHAFANATNLANITTGAALTTTPAGNGTVPTANINTLADILASCINSTGPASTPCSTLLSTALANGSSGTQPTDTATTALNIAHNPGLNVAALYALVTAQSPFQPTLGAAPNDFTLGLYLTGGGLNFPWGIAIDSSGNVWTANSGYNNVSEFSSSGTPLSPSTGFTSADLNGPRSVAIDSFGNAWFANYFGSSITKFSPSGGVLSGNTGFIGGGLNTPMGIAIDGTDNVWVANYDQLVGVTKLSNSGTALSPPGGFTGGGLYGGASIAIDNSGNAWIGNVGAGVAELSNAGTPLSPTSGYTGGGVLDAFAITIDASGDIWTANYGEYSISQLSQSGAPISPSTGYEIPTRAAQYPDAIAVDGVGNVWVAEVNGASVVEYGHSGSLLSSSFGYNSGFINYPAGVAIDGSGNVWVTNSFDVSITELIGAAAPVITPLSAGVKNHAVATRP